MDRESGSTVEHQRLREDLERKKNWKRWGPYLSERQWGTVREDYSPDGSCWTYFPHDHARSRAYRWGEDGLLGICDRECRLCFAVALWNGKDPILKERLFGLTGPEGNHGEDVKECYYYLDSSPTHSYMKALYKYPQNAFPYSRLVDVNRSLGKYDPEYELEDTGVFDESRYFDVVAEYAKNSPDDVLIKLTVINRGPQRAALHLLPTLWYRNSWSWGCTHEGCEAKPWIRKLHATAVECVHSTLGSFQWEVEAIGGAAPDLLFTDNQSNLVRLYGVERNKGHAKDAINDYVVHDDRQAVNPKSFGTKVAAHYKLEIGAGESIVIRLRLASTSEMPPEPFAEFDSVFRARKADCDDFYRWRFPSTMDPAAQQAARQAYAGLLWSKQFYHYVVKDWLSGDPSQPPPPASRLNGRNHDWVHLFNRDVISMPDKWEYPWFAAWDLAFHMIPFAKLDLQFAKEQLLLFLREWYMHPNGQIPAYEFAFNDVNPPVHAWACWRVYKMSGAKGKRDRLFLARCFQKLMLNFTWWVNRKDAEGKHIFGGGFLGLDNIGIFDRSRPLPTGGHLEQADGTAWMAFYCATMLSMSLELASEDPAYEDVASKFFEHFVAIINAMNTLGGSGLWDETDGFYYDQLHVGNTTTPLRLRSMVGVIPLFASDILWRDVLDRLPGFTKRMNWFLKHEKDLSRHITTSTHHEPGEAARANLLLAVPSRERLASVLKYVLDENEFLSPFGIRSLSRVHRDKPYVFAANGEEFRAEYVPGESNSGLFGGNSNWRGPIWFPVNYLLIEALERYHHFFGDSFKVECPTGSGRLMNLREVAIELQRRLSNLFLPDGAGKRPCHGNDQRYANDPAWKDLVLFYEHFHGDTGRGIGASHQTGWTALVTRCMEHLAPPETTATPSKPQASVRAQSRAKATV